MQAMAPGRSFDLQAGHSTGVSPGLGSGGGKLNDGEEEVDALPEGAAALFAEDPVGGRLNDGEEEVDGLIAGDGALPNAAAAAAAGAGAPTVKIFLQEGQRNCLPVELSPTCMAVEHFVQVMTIGMGLSAEMGHSGAQPRF
jgi:hypothetical protein